MARELSVAYGALTTASSPNYQLAGPVRIRRDRRTAEVSYRLVVAGDGDTPAEVRADFITAAAALEAAYSLPRQTLTILLGGTSRLTLTEGTTAYEIEPSCEKPGTTPGDTGASAVYECAVRAKLPDPVSGKGGLARLEWTAEVDAANRGALTVTGLYTRQGATGSRAAYAAGITVRVATITTLLGGTWEPVGETTSTDDYDNETTFTRRYKERIAIQAGGALDDPDLADTTLEVSRTTEAPGDAGSDVRRLQRYRASYTAAVRKGGSTTLSGAVDKAMPVIVAEFVRMAGAGVTITRLETPQDPEGSRVRIEVEAVSAGASKVVERTTTTIDRIEANTAFVDSWTELGDPENYVPGLSWEMKSPPTIERTLETTETVVGEVTPGGPATPTHKASANLGFGFGFGEILQGGFATSSLGIFALDAGASLAFEPPPEGGRDGAGDTDTSGETQQAQPGLARWAFVRASPTIRGPHELGIDAYGSKLRLTDITRSTTWRLVRDEHPAGTDTGDGGAGGNRSRVRGRATAPAPPQHPGGDGDV